MPQAASSSTASSSTASSSAASGSRVHAHRHPPRRVPLGRAIAIGVGVVAVLVLIDVFAPNLFVNALPDRAQDGLTLTLSVLIEALPWVTLGVLLSIVVQVWLPADAVQRWLPRNAWARRAVLSLLGMFIPVCECGNVPFARGLMMRGLAPAEALTFLVAAPIVNPIVILTTHAAFGWDGGVLVARLVGGYLIANLIGWVYSRHPDPRSLLTERFVETCEQVVHEVGSPTRRSLIQFLVELRAVMPALVIGSALAGAVQVLVPRDVLLAIGANPVLSILAMVALAMTVAICSNVDAFFALSFASTFSSGAIIAFLLVGPLVDVKMLALLRTTFAARVLAGLVGLVVLSACAIGIGVNVFG
ncbi:permease [Microbacterium sp. ARD32]|uniref:permease n=1 Tax=Microbacterium sp. ARD32 TaxID=2962577 RepID=UPI002881CBB1|nr:permease [Microbacterium sp. ARD32]MDT0157898.1 permease [Microbacterium sp. ARD32]